MTSPVIGTPWKKLNAPVSEEALEGVDKYWRVANYLPSARFICVPTR